MDQYRSAGRGMVRSSAMTERRHEQRANRLHEQGARDSG